MSDIENSVVLEKRQFNSKCDKAAKEDSAPRKKFQKVPVIRPITATQLFLPLWEVS